jgi:hypothetical protein
VATAIGSCCKLLLLWRRLVQVTAVVVWVLFLLRKCLLLLLLLTWLHPPEVLAKGLHVYDMACLQCTQGSMKILGIQHSLLLLLHHNVGTFHRAVARLLDTTCKAVWDQD